MRELLASGKYSDLVLQCSGCEIRVHRAYINVSSRVIERLYEQALQASHRVLSRKLED